MNRCNGKREDFSYIRDERSRVVIGYGLKELDNGLYEWYEVYLYKKQHSTIDFELVKNAIIDDINSHTDEKILSGFVWNDIPVYLSAENQRNFSEAHRMLQSGQEILPITFKLGEDEDKEPVYYTFNTAEELNDFYIKAFMFINKCLVDGWEMKDSIDWSVYEQAYEEIY